MPSILSRLFGGASASARAQDIDTKASRTGALLAMQSLGLARWTPRNASELTRQGFERNAIVYRCVRMIAESAATIPWLVYEDRIENEDHPALALLKRPNAAESGAQFLEGVFTNLMLFGNSYVELVSANGRPREWHNLRPDRMAVVPGPNGWPAAYDYSVGAQKVRFPVEPDGVSPILHLKLFHPLDDHYGFAPLLAAQSALDVHNAAGGWNKALLDNAARPSGALVYQGPDGATLSEDQFERLKKELDENFSGARNAGRPLLLEGGLDWKALSLSPKDMGLRAGPRGRRARDCAGIRHSAAGARPARRQHLLELSGSEPRLLASGGHPAGAAHAEKLRALARAGVGQLRHQGRPRQHRRAGERTGDGVAKDRSCELSKRCGEARGCGI